MVPRYCRHGDSDLGGPRFAAAETERAPRRRAPLISNHDPAPRCHATHPRASHQRALLIEAAQELARQRGTPMLAIVNGPKPLLRTSMNEFAHPPRCGCPGTPTWLFCPQPLTAVFTTDWPDINSAWNDARLELASGMLANEQDAVRTIAQRCGYQDALYFSRIFKKRFGISPRKFSPTHSRRRNPTPQLVDVSTPCGRVHAQSTNTGWCRKSVGECRHPSPRS